MRRLVISMIVVFVASVLGAHAVDAATRYKSTRGTNMRCRKVTVTRCTPKKKRVARTRTKVVTRYVPVPAAAGAGPVVNVPQQPAPIVNVPQQPAPVVNIPPTPPNTAVTVDSNFIYIIRDNQLLILDKNGLCLRQSVMLDQLSTTGPSGAGPSGAGPAIVPTTPPMDHDQMY